MTKIKLCGLKRIEDITVANEVKPDYIGFVFAKKSRRYVSEDTAALLRENLDPKIKAVGVFVDEDSGYITRLVERGIIDMVQLHGSEDDEYIERLRQSLGLKKAGKPEDAVIIRAYRISSQDDVKAAERSPADIVLLDSGMGSGMTFDWNEAAGIDRPFILAGGLDCETVVSAIGKLSPYAVDVSSGIETQGVKDPARMREFVKRVRTCDMKREDKI
ncbi:MAG: phosphoribosylanthranilate isomerase [Lachnospiraceae bacterium]|nr:phosphoribosylanthranilate isomerase [Lachnospiraceae bacterium]